MGMSCCYWCKPQPPIEIDGERSEYINITALSKKTKRLLWEANKLNKPFSKIIKDPFLKRLKTAFGGEIYVPKSLLIIPNSLELK